MAGEEAAGEGREVQRLVVVLIAYLRVCVCERAREPVCVCGCARACGCVCALVCVCARLCVRTRARMHVPDRRGSIPSERAKAAALDCKTGAYLNGPAEGPSRVRIFSWSYPFMAEGPSRVRIFSWSCAAFECKTGAGLRLLGVVAAERPSRVRVLSWSCAALDCKTGAGFRPLGVVEKGRGPAFAPWA